MQKNSLTNKKDMMKAIILESRLKYELKNLNENKKFSLIKDENNSRIWYVLFDGVENTLYEKEKFKLRFEFSDEYVNYVFIFNIII